MIVVRMSYTIDDESKNSREGAAGSQRGGAADDIGSQCIEQTLESASGEGQVGWPDSLVGDGRDDRRLPEEITEKGKEDGGIGLILDEPFTSLKKSSEFFAYSQVVGTFDRFAF